MCVCVLVDSVTPHHHRRNHNRLHAVSPFQNDRDINGKSFYLSTSDQQLNYIDQCIMYTQHPPYRPRHRRAIINGNRPFKFIRAHCHIVRDRIAVELSL